MTEKTNRIQRLLNSITRLGFRLPILNGSAVLLLTLLATAALAQNDWPRFARSADGTPISYEVYGAGEPTLIFVHGWSCDSRYWRCQVPYFARSHRVITLDLAGHGHSGTGRSRYSMTSFGADVQAVAVAAGVERAILIGHSMGGPVVAEAARLMPERICGLIGIDTLENIEYPLSETELAGMIAPLEADFPKGCREFVGAMLRSEGDAAVRAWILDDMSSAPKAVALSAMREMMGQYLSGEIARTFESLKIPVVTVNADLWPIDYAANRRHMTSYEAIVIKDTDHFLMLNQAAAFNKALARAIAMLPDQPGGN
ncbi:MAG: Arylesterase [Deltaproteobacteria bacterium ADurb.Bin510]|nr:MAG: Arylesterase [Deltaproteobacteria bacterium ADurb.Bin510]